jgi:hypothetical protein
MCDELVCDSLQQSYSDVFWWRNRLWIANGFHYITLHVAHWLTAAAAVASGHLRT